MILVVTRLISSECHFVKCLNTFCEYLDLNFIILCLSKEKVTRCVCAEKVRCFLIVGI